MIIEQLFHEIIADKVIMSSTELTESSCMARLIVLILFSDNLGF